MHAAPSDHTHSIEITVNGREVTVQGPRTTGLEIKRAAIARGVNIQLDFVLSEEIGDRRTRVIGDGDVVAVHPRSKFIAVAPDDNS
jgi:hypothetical protein